ncbi:MAG: molybdenum cofactor biosynthesis protein MoaE [Gemmatimonadales bacterium]|jgi:molybdopterin synthase catalytic subunit
MSGYGTREPIDLTALLRTVTGAGRGGTVVFLGSVRRSDDDGPVAGIDYSAYEEMLDDEFGRILSEAEGRWRGVGITGQHRLGRVATGEPSIAVVASAPHRDEAFAACRWVVNQAKQRLPVWKKEHFDDGTTRWREG